MANTVRVGGIIQGRCRVNRSSDCPTPPSATIDPFQNPAHGGATGDGGASWYSGGSIGSNLPVVFGWAPVGGMVIGANSTHKGGGTGFDDCRDIMYALCKGPVQGIEDQDIFEGTGAASRYTDWSGARASYLTLYDKMLGDYMQSPATHYATDPGVAGDFVYSYPGVAHLTICALYQIASPAGPGWVTLPAIRAWVSGFNRIYSPRGTRLTYNSFDGIPAYVWSDNPALILACVMTNPDWGGRIAESEINWTSVDDAADYCDELINVGSVIDLHNVAVSGAVATVTAHAAHGLYPGDRVCLSGLSGGSASTFNGHWRVRYGNGSTTFTLANEDMSPFDATGLSTTTSDTGDAQQERRRWTLNLCMARSATLESWVETICSHAGLHVVRQGGLYQIFADKAATSVYTFTNDHALSQNENKTYRDVPASQRSEVTFANYYGKRDSTYGYRTTETVRVHSPEQITVENESDRMEYQFEGCDNADQAQAAVDLIQNKQALELYEGTMEVSLEGLLPSLFDIITTEEFLDLTGGGSVMWRIISCAIRADHSCQYGLRWYDATVYPA